MIKFTILLVGFMYGMQNAVFTYPNIEYFSQVSENKPFLILLSGPDGWAGALDYISNNDKIRKIFNTYSLSLPNQGSSFGLDQMTLEILSNVVVDFIRKVLGVRPYSVWGYAKNRVYIAGDYIGGKVAMEVAARYPYYVNGIYAQSALPYASPQTFIDSERDFYTKLAALNLQRKLSDITIDINQLAGDSGYASTIVKNLSGSEGNYGFRFNLNPYLNNIDNLEASVFNSPYKGKVKLVNVDMDFTPKAKQDQLLQYYPNIVLEKDVIWIDQISYINPRNIEVIVKALEDLAAN